MRTLPIRWRCAAGLERGDRHKLTLSRCRSITPVRQAARNLRLHFVHGIPAEGVPVDFLLTAKRDPGAAKRFFRKALKGQPLLAPGKIGTDGASVYPKAIEEGAKDGLTPSAVQHRVAKHLQQGIESDHFHVKKNMPKIGGFRSFATAKRTIAGFEAMLWLKKGFGFAGEWTVRRQNELLALCFGLEMVNNP